VANQSSGASGQGGGARRGRRPPTIDLAAEEVKRADAERSAERPSENPSEKSPEAGPAEDATMAGEQDKRKRRPTPEAEPVIPSAFAAPAGTARDERPARSRGAFAAGLLAASLAGGLIVLAGLLALDRAGLLPLGDRAAETAALRGQVAALEEELAAARQAAELGGEDLQAQLADLNARVAALAEAAPADAAPAEPPPTDQPLAEEVAELQAALAGLRDELGAPSVPAALEEVGERLERLEVLPERLTALSERLDALQSAPRQDVGDGVGTEVAGLTDRMEALDERLAELAGRLEAAASAEDIEAVQARLTTGLEEAAAQLRSGLQESESRLQSGQEEAAAQLSALAQQMGHVQAAVAAEALADALAAGRPFAAELEAVGAFGIDEEALSALRPYAESGLPGRAELRRRFGEAAERLRQAEAPPPSDTGALERLWQSARNVVEVRPAGPQQGESATAVASRIEAALAAGDLARALEEWQDLPPEAQEGTRDWAEAARAVLAGEALAARLRQEALAGLTAPRS
jgi:hypothetical protein